MVVMGLVGEQEGAGEEQTLGVTLSASTSRGHASKSGRHYHNKASHHDARKASPGMRIKNLPPRKKTCLKMNPQGREKRNTIPHR